MHKCIIVTAGFIIIFALIFAVLQPVFMVKSDENMTIAQFYNEPEDSLDVLIIGSSDTRAAVIPAVFWDDAGISSYNLSLSNMNQATQYYVLREALRFQSPSVVFIHTDYIFLDIDFNSARSEAWFRQALDYMRWSPVKLDSVRDILSKSDTQSFLDYLFPLLRYHDRDDLSRNDFDLSFRKQRNLSMGSWRDKGPYREQERPDGFIETEEFPVIYDEYMIKMIEMCKERGIEAVLINPPTCSDEKLTITRHIALRNFAKEQDVTLLDFDTPELFGIAGIDVSRDFTDPNHLNIAGGTKISLYLSAYLKETFNLPDRRLHMHDPHWDDVLELYNLRYMEMLSSFS